MAHERRDGSERGRSRAAPTDRSRGDDARCRQDRSRIAQVAARLIAEHGLDDWGLAKRKAARQLLLPDSTPFPSNEEIEQALFEFHALFGGDAHVRTLRAQRARALDWMQRLSSWAPLLVGGVAAGWAGAHADVRIELAADDPKVVEMMLAGCGVRYEALSRPAQDSSTELLIAESTTSIRLTIVGVNDRRSRPRKDTDVRLDIAALRALAAGG
jgi:hypothetical protein